MTTKTTTGQAPIEPRPDDHEEVFPRQSPNTDPLCSLSPEPVDLSAGLPIDVARPNTTTRQTFESTDSGHDLTVCRDADELFDSLAI